MITEVEINHKNNNFLDLSHPSEQGLQREGIPFQSVQSHKRELFSLYSEESPTSESPAIVLISIECQLMEIRCPYSLLSDFDLNKNTSLLTE